MKRAASPRATTLKARASPFHASVTLFQLPDGVSTPGTSRRRSKRLKIESETEAVPDLEEPQAFAFASSSGTVTKRAGSGNTPRKAKPIVQSLGDPQPAPRHWQQTYDTIKEMRSRIVAPVDTMGCDQAQHKETDPKNRRFATLVSLMLSSQTKDEVTDAAVSKLRAALGGTLSVDAMIAAKDAVVSGAIAKVGFWRRKTQYLKQTAQRLHDDFESDVPKTVDELCSLPGVGPKMAFLALQVAWNLNLGIGVDVHVHRITNRLGWHKKPTKNPEETRLNLQSWLPKELHGEINHLLVGFGQTVCLPVGPRCDTCDVGNKGMCPSARKARSPKRKVADILSEIAAPKVEIEIDRKEGSSTQVRSNVTEHSEME